MALALGIGGEHRLACLPNCFAPKSTQTRAPKVKLKHITRSDLFPLRIKGTVPPERRRLAATNAFEGMAYANVKLQHTTRRHSVSLRVKGTVPHEKRR